ncbi:MAG TPA: SGNH/GDSL hydrolase family protein [Anaerolineales bacterium]|nr:SGNH/GDSL hydrolase family protein [Anaerolineales bacterium]HNA90376.1 SGNH/GDSL hydrolase family protein [Anaerolineales bacterium]
MKLKHIAIVLLFLSGLILQACSAPKTCDEITNGQECLRILFIGNSYTFTNDLPGTFAELARSGAHQVEVQMVAEGGWGFDDHMSAFDTITAIKSKEWDYIVLQERSQNPAVPYSRTNDMYPAARALVAQIRAVGAKPIFFVTWGYKNGSPDIELPDYISMQIAVDKGYQAIAQELNVTLAPVGDAWYNALKASPPPELWQEDGSHPSPIGTYLAANVFYATIFNESPVGLSYRGGVSKEEAAQMQKVAALVVLKIR